MMLKMSLNVSKLHYSAPKEKKILSLVCPSQRLKAKISVHHYTRWVNNVLKFYSYSRALVIWVYVGSASFVCLIYAPVKIISFCEQVTITIYLTGYYLSRFFGHMLI